MILFLSNADTDLLAVRSVLEGLPDGFPPVGAANPASLPGAPALHGVQVVLVRLLGGRRAWEGQFDELRRRCVAAGVPLLAFAGEAAPDAELTAFSTAPAATVGQAFEYLVHGGLANVEGLLRFVSDTVLMTGFGFDPPEPVPAYGVFGGRSRHADRPTVGIVFYRAHLLSGNTQFVDDLADAIEARGGNALPVFCYSLRPGPDGKAEAVELLRAAGVDAVVTTVLAMGSTRGDQWDASGLAELGVPVVQAVASTRSRQSWEDNDAGLGPMDVAMSVAIPEFDGRVISVPFSFKEVVDDGDSLGSPVTAYRTVPDRVARVAGTAVRLAALAGVTPAERKVAVVLSAYPTKRSRMGNAVALDTPASVIELLRSLRAAGYRVDRIPDDGDALMDELARTLVYDRESLTAPQLASAAGRWSAAAYRSWFESLPAGLADSVRDSWGEAPGAVYVDSGDLVFPGIDLGGVLVAVQPPRGFGENPIAVYHSPDLPPTHHYLAFYRWLDQEWGAHAVVHAGKHGTLEWLPGKGVGLSADCAPDAALGDLPFVYPFVVNDPGEGTQAKRRAHAVVVDHLLPPMTRADTYDDLARLESLLDEHARIAALDPSKLPAVRAQVWDLLVEAEIHRDLGVEDAPEGDAFDELVLHVDGYLCELKDAQIRGGLHVLGQSPAGEAEVDLVLAITRLPQAGVPSLRAQLPPGATRVEVDRVEEANRRTLAGLQAAGWRYEGDDPTLRWVCDRLIPSLRRTPDEIGNVLAALDGRYVPSGPSGAPTRGMAHVLPTGRNFYSVDPKAVPSPLAWEVGCRLADQLVERHWREEGRLPRCVGLVVWGTSAMRTMGDDVAEALALIGVRPVWQEESARVVGVELISEDDLGRPRVDVTLRISGFFRDAFPHVVSLLDEAFALAGFGDDPRIFGAKPGAYGSGILALLESRDWRSDADLAAVYEAWSGWAYGRSASGVPAADAMRRRFAAIDVAVKNQDNREHDIFDSDDYLQDHGGMIATVRALTGGQPKAWFGDSADPARPRVRSLAEEAARVVRTRVVNPKWIAAMQRHGYKGAFEMAATVDYLFGYDATARVVEDWMYERVTRAYVADPEVRKFFQSSNPWALRSIAERLLEARDRGLWDASDESLAALRSALLEAEGWEESR
ncbi:MAG TPA: cobaltochelatase subunit CobN [Acidimicrobiales bacterium]|nr:cobaltochelatase subunit CobN [Acidimicrobiales bacterium]